MNRSGVPVFGYPFDFRPIFLAIGYLLDIVGLALALPAVIEAAAGREDWPVFTGSASFVLFIGTLLILTNRGAPFQLTTRQGIVFTLMAWLLIALVGSLPLALSGLKLTYTDAFFESMSGLTTTGSTVIVGLDTLPTGILLWRAILQWLGGIGVVVMAMAILPMLRVGGMQLFRIESSDSSDRPFPLFGDFVIALVTIYVLLTAVCAFLLRLSGIPWFDSLVHAMTTLSTGGFSTSDGSVGHFANPAAEWIITVFMILGSLPFVLYMRAVQARPHALFRDGQVLCLLVFLGLVVIAVAVWLWAVDDISPALSLRMAAFNITSIITTTGYSTADYAQWGTFPIGVFFVITVVGGCTGSTAGGIKIFRFQLFGLVLRSYLGRLISPHTVRPMIYNGRQITPDAAMGGMLYICVFLVTIAAVAGLLEAFGIDLLTAVTAAATSVANVGPGLGSIIGPTGNFAPLPDAAKWLLAFAMLFGRLEIFAVLLLFTPEFWRY